MKTIIQFLLVVTICFFSAAVQGQYAEETTFYQSIPVADASLAILECSGPVEVKIWEEDYIKVYTNVTCEGLKAGSLRQLAVDGRYELVSKMGLNNFLTISQPKTDSAFKVNQKDYKEQINYIVYVPSYLDIEVDAPNDLVADHKPVLKESSVNLYTAYNN